MEHISADTVPQGAPDDITEENRHDEVRVSPPTDEVSRLREALEHVTELLVDTWHTAMDGDPEKEAAVADARAELTRFSTQQGGD